ncbi:MAG: hypothetical protein LBH06_07140 [Rikenellaceae bacterium]|jgi:hypothetical protein|nr:hypothetical protein [Rikenellaceae bacterium]
MGKLINKIMLLTITAVACTACINSDYRLQDLETDNIVLFGDGLVFPLGKADPKTLRELLEEGDADFITFDDQTGLMSINFDEQQEVSLGDDLDFTAIAATGSLDDYIGYPTISAINTPFTTQQLSAEEITFDVIMPPGVISLSSIDFGGGPNGQSDVVTLSISGVPATMDISGLSVTIDPSMTIVADPSLDFDPVTRSFPLKNGRSAYTFRVTRIDFATPLATSTYSYAASFSIGGTVKATTTLPAGQLDITVDFDAAISAVTGEFDLSVNNDAEFPLDGIERIRNSQTDINFDDPTFNLGIDILDGDGAAKKLPVGLTTVVKLIPVVGGVDGNGIEIPLRLGTEHSHYDFTVKNSGVTSPSSQGGYSHPMSIDLNTLFVGQPEKIKAEYEIKTSTGTQTLNLNDIAPEYNIGLKFGMPLSLGQSFAIAFRDTVSFDMLDEETVDRLFHSDNNRIELGCEVESTIPLGMQLTVVPCNENYEALTGVNTTLDGANTVRVQAGQRGAPARSTVNIALYGPKEQLKELRNIIFEVVAKPGQGQGGQLYGDGYFSLPRVWGKLNGGIHLGKIKE